MGKTRFLLAIVSIAAISGGCSRSDSPSAHTNLSSVEPLRQAFNADSGKVRAIFLASPTCAECLKGAAALQSAWLAKDSLKDVAVYVVWSSQLGAQEKHVASASALVPDRRARQYWDSQMLVGSAYQPVLHTSAAAWDTWMLFDKNAVWRADAVPRPAWWEHQLSGPPQLKLDPDRWASHAIALHDVNSDHQ